MKIILIKSNYFDYLSQFYTKKKHYFKILKSKLFIK